MAKRWERRWDRRGYFYVFFLFASIFIIFVESVFSQSPEDSRIPFILPPRSKLLKIRSAVIETVKGKIYIELYPELAPWHVANFKYLADKHFYDGKEFHIYRPGHLIQAGKAGSSPLSGPGYTLRPEFNELKHEPGAVGMARIEDIANLSRRSHGSQFYIMLGYAPNLDRNYTLFGKVVAGMDVVRKLRKGDKIISLRVYVRE